MENYKLFLAQRYKLEKKKSSQIILNIINRYKMIEYNEPLIQRHSFAANHFEKRRRNEGWGASLTKIEET